MKKVLFFAILAACLVPLRSSAQFYQFVLGSAGGEITSSNGEISFIQSIGDVAGTFVKGSTAKFVQGFPDCFNCNDCVVVEVVELVPELHLSLFPNPSSGWLVLEGDTDKVAGYQIFNSQGALLSSSGYTGGQIDLQMLPGGLYFICFMDDQGKWLGTAKVLRQ